MNVVSLKICTVGQSTIIRWSDIRSTAVRKYQDYTECHSPLIDETASDSSSQRIGNFIILKDRDFWKKVTEEESETVGWTERRQKTFFPTEVSKLLMSSEMLPEFCAVWMILERYYQMFTCFDMSEMLWTDVLTWSCRIVLLLWSLLLLLYSKSLFINFD